MEECRASAERAMKMERMNEKLQQKLSFLSTFFSLLLVTFNSILELLLSWVCEYELVTSLY